MKIERTREFTFLTMFSLPSASSDLKVPIDGLKTGRELKITIFPFCLVNFKIFKKLLPACTFIQNMGVALIKHTAIVNHG